MSENPVWLLATSVYAMLSTWAVCLLAERIARRFRLMDYPSERKLHSQPTPLVGGVTLIVVLMPIMPIIMIVFDPQGIGNLSLSVIALGTALCALVGISDDRHSLGAPLRIAATLAIFIAAAYVDPRFMISTINFSQHAGSHILVPGFSWLLSLLVLVGFINAVNMADGKNGLVIGASICWCFMLIHWSQRIGDHYFADCIDAMHIADLQYAWSYFLGDGGSYGLSAFFGLTAIFSYNLAPASVTSDLMTLMFIVPGIDMIRLFFVRIARGKSPMLGDRDHLHHHLFKLFGWPQGLFAYLALMILPVMVSFAHHPASPHMLVISLALYAAIITASSVQSRRVTETAAAQVDQ